MRGIETIVAEGKRTKPEPALKRKPAHTRIVEWSEEPVGEVVLAHHIVEVSKAAERILKGPLTEDAIVLLIHGAAKGKVGRPEIRTVLRTAAMLRKLYVRE